MFSAAHFPRLGPFMKIPYLWGLQVSLHGTDSFTSSGYVHLPHRECPFSPLSGYIKSTAGIRVDDKITKIHPRDDRFTPQGISIDCLSPGQNNKTNSLHW